MTFTHKDFKKATGLPDPTPGIKNLYAFCIEYGPKLVGPFPVVIEVAKDTDPYPGKLFIRPPGKKHPFWSDYGGPNRWGQSGSYLVFATPEQVEADPVHVLLPSPDES